ncbi:hypothetical protein BJ912DRAFT_1130372 [Pholiota molesta]|nr:hypothetical protein BJ912DRAFT_1130372 [Pholiota molesta]
MICPFDSMPNEIISLMFHEAVIAYSDDAEYIFSMQLSDTRTLLSISLVCKRWREVSLSNGRLWASAISVDCDSPTWVHKLTLRAKSAPLGIHSNRSEHYEENLFETPNWECALGRVNPINSGPLLRALTQPASSLHSFHINNLARPDQDDLDDDEFNSKLFILPDNLFAGDAPCLREFAITNAFLRPSFDFSVWEQLTELFVDQALGGLQGNKILSRQWLDILRQMKQLEYLGLVWAYNVAFDEALHLLPEELEPDHNITNMADVHLDHLHTLWLMASSERNIMLDIFSKLVVPDTCFTSITVTHNPREDLRFDRLSTGLNHRAKGWRAANIPFYLRLLQGANQFGFQIELYNKSTDLEDYAFRFHFLGSGIEEDLPEDADAIPQSVDETSPFSRVMEVLKNACEQTSLTLVP